MLSTYGEILRLNRAWRFSAAGFILRLPMSIMPISIILSIQAAYGNYTLAGVVSAINIIALAVTAPMWARLVDRYGQLKIMGPVFAVSAIATTVLLFATLEVASTWILFVSAGIAGATWGSPGALVRARWIRATDTVAQLNSAFALEAAVDEFVYIVGPVIATVLGTALHPTTGVAVSIVFLVLGAALFLGQRSSEPVPVSHRSPVHLDEAGEASTSEDGPSALSASTPRNDRPHADVRGNGRAIRSKRYRGCRIHEGTGCSGAFRRVAGHVLRRFLYFCPALWRAKLASPPVEALRRGRRSPCHWNDCISASELLGLAGDHHVDQWHCLRAYHDERQHDGYEVGSSPSSNRGPGMAEYSDQFGCFPWFFRLWTGS